MEWLNEFETWQKHGTKILGLTGLVQQVLSSVLALSVIPLDQMRSWLIANAILSAVLGAGTIKRGFTNTAAVGK